MTLSRKVNAELFDFRVEIMTGTCHEFGRIDHSLRAQRAKRIQAAVRHRASPRIPSTRTSALLTVPLITLETLLQSI